MCYHDIFLQIIGMIFFIAASSRTEAVRVKGGENKGIIFQLEDEDPLSPFAQICTLHMLIVS